MYEFNYVENDMGANIETKPLFEWESVIRFVALKKEESWGVLVTEEDATYFF